MRTDLSWSCSPRRLLGIVALAASATAAFGASPVHDQLGPLPLAFEPNRGQIRPEFPFVGRAGGSSVYLNSTGITFRPPVRDAAPVTMHFVGAKADARAEGLNKQPGVSNYYRGDNPAKWITGIPQYGKVRFDNLYRGIDVVYYGNHGKIEYDLVVTPGADPNRIRLRFEGAAQISLSESGDLVLGTGGSRVLMQKPLVYQERAGKRESVPGRYVLSASNEVRFEVGKYDWTRPVVIDPTIIFSAVIGGNAGGNYANGVVSDAAGNIFVTGYTTAADFPVVGTSTFIAKGSTDAFVVKIDANTTPTKPTVLFSTYISGSGDDIALGIAVDNSGDPAITGYTSSPDFPRVPPAFQSTRNGASDAFFTKLAGASGLLLASTYYGGSGTDQGSAIASDGTNFYVGGSTASTDLPAAAGPAPGGGDGFVVKFSNTGSALAAKYLGGSAYDEVDGIAIDLSASGNTRIVAGGWTGSNNFPVTNGSSLGTERRAGFITRLDNPAMSVNFSTLVGGGSDDAVNAVGVDGSGAMYGAGTTRNADLPNALNAPANSSSGDGFVLKLNSSGVAQYTRYIGGSRNDSLLGLAVKSDGTVVAAGTTLSPDLPTASAIQPSLAGDSAPLLTSVNGGVTWTAASSGLLGSRSTLGAGVSPDVAPGKVVAATDAGIFLSTNSGGSWTATLAGVPVQILARAPSSPLTMYAAAQGSAGSSPITYFYKSTTGGQTWTPSGNVPGAVVALAVDAGNAAIVYAATASSGLYRSPDGGATWTPVTSLSRPELRGVVADPVQPNIVYVAPVNEGVFKSTDAGATWIPTGAGVFSTVSALAVSTVGNVGNYFTYLYALGSGRVYASPDGGSTWSLTGFPGTSAISVVASLSNPAVVFVGTGNGEVWTSSNGGANWTKQASPGQGAATLPVVILAVDSTSRLWASVVIWRDAVVVKLDSFGGIVYTTYLGGSGSDLASSAAFHATSGDALVAGGTSSTDFPLTALPVAPFKTAVNPSTDAFVARIKDATDACNFTLSPVSGFASSGGGRLTVGVAAPSGCAWTATTADGFITITNPNGTGTGSVGLLIGTGDPNVSRTGHVTIAGRTFTVTQPAASCTYSLTSSAGIFFGAGGGQTVGVLAGAGCPWQLDTPLPGWVTSFTPTSSTGTGNPQNPSVFSYTVAPNNAFATRNAFLSVGGQPYQISQAALSACVYSLDSTSLSASADGQSNASFNVTTNVGTCGWTPRAPAWITVNTPAATAVGSGPVRFSVAPNTSTVPRTGTISVGTQTFTVTQAGVVIASEALRFVPLPPCRIADTRLPNGPYGGPFITGGTSRDFVAQGVCGVPVSAKAYSLNVTVVPLGPLGYLTVYPAGGAVPISSTLNSLDGRIKANAAIIGAGANGAISVFPSNSTHLVLDVNGYFVAATDPAGLAFYTLAPCRIADTRFGTGPFGQPFLTGQQPRTFPIRSSACGVPATAEAYSLNFTVVPKGPLGYLTVYPTGQGTPTVSTLNSLTGVTTANAAIVKAGTNGSIDVFASNSTDLVIDVNGYFAPPVTGGLSLYTVPPCRVIDTRVPGQGPGLSGGVTRNIDVPASGCLPTGVSPDAYASNATVVPPGPLGYLTLWPQGGVTPTVSTLNSLDATITSNMAIVPTINGQISAFASNPTQLVLDLFGYFAP